jgi:hypothetical protein
VVSSLLTCSQHKKASERTMGPSSGASALVYGSHVHVPNSSVKGTPTAAGLPSEPPATVPTSDLIQACKALPQVAGPQPFHMDSLPIRRPTYCSSASPAATRKGRSNQGPKVSRSSIFDPGGLDSSLVQQCLILQNAMAAGMAAWTSNHLPALSPTPSPAQGIDEKKAKPLVSSKPCHKEQGIGTVSAQAPAPSRDANCSADVDGLLSPEAGHSGGVGTGSEPTYKMFQRNRGRSGICVGWQGQQGSGKQMVPGITNIEKPPVAPRSGRPCAPYSMEYGMLSLFPCFLGSATGGSLLSLRWLASQMFLIVTPSTCSECSYAILEVAFLVQIPSFWICHQQSFSRAQLALATLAV